MWYVRFPSNTVPNSIGEPVLFYHSNIKPAGVVGLAKISGEARPDPTALDRKSMYFDPKATSDKPIWHYVEIKFVKKFANLIPLHIIKEQEGLKKMFLIKKGMRLSIQPATKSEFELICSLGKKYGNKRIVS